MRTRTGSMPLPHSSKPLALGEGPAQQPPEFVILVPGAGCRVQAWGASVLGGGVLGTTGPPVQICAPLERPGCTLTGACICAGNGPAAPGAGLSTVCSRSICKGIISYAVWCRRGSNPTPHPCCCPVGSHCRHECYPPPLLLPIRCPVMACVIPRGLPCPCACAPSCRYRPPSTGRPPPAVLQMGLGISHATAFYSCLGHISRALGTQGAGRPGR